jgi:hypothetical protein
MSDDVTVLPKLIATAPPFVDEVQLVKLVLVTLTGELVTAASDRMPTAPASAPVQLVNVDVVKLITLLCESALAPKLSAIAPPNPDVASHPLAVILSNDTVEVCTVFKNCPNTAPPFTDASLSVNTLLFSSTLD